MHRLFAPVIMLLVAGILAPSSLAAEIEAPACGDDAEAIGTAVVGTPKAIQGGPAQVRIERWPAHSDVDVSGLTVKVNAVSVATLEAPVFPAVAIADITLPEKRDIVVSVSWTQGSAPSTGAACVGIDSYRVRAFVNRTRLSRYVAAVGTVQPIWQKGRAAYLACVNAIDTSDSASWRRAAACLLRARGADSTTMRYQAIAAPPGFVVYHRGLIRSAAIRKRNAALAASVFSQAADAVARGRIPTLPEFLSGTKSLRASWVRAVRSEARAVGAPIPAWVKRVGS